LSTFPPLPAKLGTGGPGGELDKGGYRMRVPAKLLIEKKETRVVLIKKLATKET
jgi:hypothetical protein